VVVTALYETERPHDISGGRRRLAPTETQKVSSSVRVLLVEDQTLLRQGLASLLRTANGMQVVGEAANGREALALAERLLPDVVLMDIAMPVMGGLEATREIARRCPGTRILVLSTPSYADQMLPILRAGAAGTC
jgi:DNA-binding NarL/FixJ family response regulator